MEVALEFATFCNICFNKENLRKIEETEHLTSVLMMFIESKIVLKGQEIYLCLNCCEKLESYEQFKEMCLRNFIDFRIEYSKLKNTLEIINDPNVEKKLRNFIKTKIYGDSDLLSVDNSEDPLHVEHNVISVEDTEKNLTEKENQGNDNLLRIRRKTVKVEYEDIEKYKFHTELDLEDNEGGVELPVPVEYVKVESFVEDFGATVSNNNKLIEQINSSGPQTTNKVCDTTTKATHHNKRTPGQTLRKNTQSIRKEASDVECSICKKSFSYISKLNRHMRTHTRERQYTCTICNKSFVQSSSLKIHTAVHTGEKRYSCKVCNKTYYQLCNLKEHERVHTGEKPYACSMCDKTFSISGNLRKHELVHTREKIYTCGICQKSFHRREYLKRHIRVHTGEKPYECTECNKRFACQSNYKTHKLMHTEEIIGV